jgi:putative transposase
LELVALKAAIEQVQQEYAFSERRACRLMTMAVTTYRYRSLRTDEPLRMRLVELAREKPRFGYRRLHVLLRRSGEQVNHKRVHRVYREAGLALRRKKRKHSVREGKPLVVRTSANQEWALDFVHDAVECGRTIRVLSVEDAYRRECLALEVDTSFASRRVTRVLEAIIAERGQPLAIRCDNGPELTSRHFLAWCVERQIELVHIQPGKPMQNRTTRKSSRPRASDRSMCCLPGNRPACQLQEPITSSLPDNDATEMEPRKTCARTREQKTRTQRRV